MAERAGKQFSKTQQAEISAKTEIGDARLYLFRSLLKMPNSPLPWEIESKKIWLKQLKAAPALVFSYFQHVSKLVTHDTEKSETVRFRTSFFYLTLYLTL